MTTLPGTIKTWRTPVSDTFNDARFFQMSPEMSLRWQQPVFALFGSDPERLVELVGKISAASSVGIFTNREAEMLARATNMRRLSFVILCSSQDYFLAQLPAIQDKIVSVLRAGPADVVAAEVRRKAPSSAAQADRPAGVPMHARPAVPLFRPASLGLLAGASL